MLFRSCLVLFFLVAVTCVGIYNMKLIQDRLDNVVGVNNNTDFLRATREGTLTAEATPIHRGRTQQLWEVRITDENDRLVSKGQVRLANITEVAKIGN